MEMQVNGQVRQKTSGIKKTTEGRKKTNKNKQTNKNKNKNKNKTTNTTMDGKEEPGVKLLRFQSRKWIYHLFIYLFILLKPDLPRVIVTV